MDIRLNFLPKISIEASIEMGRTTFFNVLSNRISRSIRIVGCWVILVVNLWLVFSLHELQNFSHTKHLSTMMFFPILENSEGVSRMGISKGISYWNFWNFSKIYQSLIFTKSNLKKVLETRHLGEKDYKIKQDDIWWPRSQNKWLYIVRSPLQICFASTSNVFSQDLYGFSHCTINLIDGGG